MTFIRLKNVVVDLPVYNARARSLKRAVMTLSIGGRISHDERDRVVVRALDCVNLELKDGDRVGLIGHNGAGKSTLLRIMAGLCEPTSGRTEVQGRVSSLLSLGAAMDPEMTGFENIEHVGALVGIAPHRWAVLRDDIATVSGLGQFLELPVRTYSTGMQLRLSFALLTAQEPDILLLDEAVGVGDAQFVKIAERRVLELGERARILVLASHSFSYLRNMCDTVVWLEHGRVRMTGPTNEVLEVYAANARQQE